MSSVLPPEAIRGSWYIVSGSPRPVRGSQQICAFRTDGTFSRVQIKDGAIKVGEQGQYTFDGNFLILRGRNTDTFRVHPQSHWLWELEGKKKATYLIRGLVDAEDMPELTAQALRDIRILPMRAAVRSELRDDDTSIQDYAIYHLTYTAAGDEEKTIGAFFVERHPDNHLWVGVTPFVEGIKDEVWERIIRDSYLDIFLGKPKAEVSVVTVRLLDKHESKIFNYQL